MNDFDKLDKELLKKKLDYREFSSSQQAELLGLDLNQMKRVLSEMKRGADSVYRQREFAEAIELYLKGFGSFLRLSWFLRVFIWLLVIQVIMSLPTENCKLEHQEMYFFEYFVPCSLNIVSCTIEQKQLQKSILMLQNFEQSLNQKQWKSIGQM